MLCISSICCQKVYCNVDLFVDVVKFADEKTTWKILQQAQQQQEELQQEFGLTRYLCYDAYTNSCPCFAPSETHNKFDV